MVEHFTFLDDFNNTWIINGNFMYFPKKKKKKNNCQ